MNLYLKFDAWEARNSKSGCSMVLDTQKCSKFDARTHSMLEKRVLEVSLCQTTISDFLSSIQEVSYVVLDYFRILRPKKCLQDFTWNFEDFERGDSLLWSCVWQTSELLPWFQQTVTIKIWALEKIQKLGNKYFWPDAGLKSPKSEFNFLDRLT